MKRGKDGYLPVIRLLMMPLPGVSEGVAYGAPAFYVSKKSIARMKEDGQTLMVYTPDRNEWTGRHYVLVDLIKVERVELSALLAEAWRSRAAKNLLRQGSRL